MKSFKNERGSIEIILVIVIVVGLLIGGGWYAWNLIHKASKTTSQSPSMSVQAVSHPGVVTSEVFAPKLDPMGAAVGPTKTFTTTSPHIYVVLGLTGAKSIQRIEYTRYLDGKFINNGSIPLKDGATSASLAFNLKPNKTHTTGVYTVKVYTNGVFERSATYTVQ